MLQRLTAAGLLLTLTTGCFTSAVWGSQLYDDGYEPSSVPYPRLLGDSIPLMILATPFSVALDLCSLPVQAAIFGWDDDDDDWPR